MDVIPNWFTCKSCGDKIDLTKLEPSMPVMYCRKCVDKIDRSHCGLSDKIRSVVDAWCK